MTPEEWGRRQAALAPPWSDKTFRLVLASLGYAQLPESDLSSLLGSSAPLPDDSTHPLVITPRFTPTTQ